MLTLTGMFKSIFDLRRGGRSGLRRSTANHRQTPSRAAGAAEIETNVERAVERAKEEQQFLASIADLPLEQRQRRIAKREWYRQLSERQARIAAEHSAAQRERD